MAADAGRMPAREAAFRNLVLNQRVEAEDPFLAVQYGRRAPASPPISTGREVYGGARSVRGRRSDRAWS